MSDNQEQEGKVKDMSVYLLNSRKGKFLYKYMQFLMFIEGLLWSFMDITRRKRMRVASKINRNYKSDR